MNKVEETNRHKLIWDFQKEIIKVYEENDLTNLSGLHRDFILNGKNILKWYYEAIETKNARDPNFDFHRCFDDLIFCSDEILFYTALLYLYRPYLQNPIEDAYPFDGKIIYPYTQTIEVSRFNMFTNSLYEKIYNYWDRIGDLIAAFFPDIFKDSSNIYFVKSIDKFPSKFSNSENFLWLKSFRDNQFKEVNSKRVRIVHYELAGTSNRWDHIENPTNKLAIEKIVNERNNLPDFFKDHINYTKIGFEKTIQLIEEITIK